MRVVSVNVSLGRTVEWRGRLVTTGIFKEPVPHRVRLLHDHVDGDRQLDRTVHGGPDKAVYAYALSHYDWWARELGRELAPGTFGENLTIEGLDEDDVRIGDRFVLRSAVVEAVQPRLPCFKLGVRFNDAGMVRRFLQAGRYGTYFRVITAGDVGVGDEVQRTSHDPSGVPVKALASFLDRDGFDHDLARRAIASPSLPRQWYDHIVELLSEQAAT